MELEKISQENANGNFTIDENISHRRKLLTWKELAEETLSNYTRDVLGDPEKLMDFTKTEIKRIKNLYEIDNLKFQRAYDFQAHEKKMGRIDYNSFLDDIQTYFDMQLGNKAMIDQNEYLFL